MRLSSVDGSSAPLRTHLLVGSDMCLADVLCSSVEAALFVYVEVGNVFCPKRASTVPSVKAVHLLEDDAPDTPGTRWPRRPRADARTAELLREALRTPFQSLREEILPILRSFPDAAGHPRGDAKATCASCGRACSLVVLMTQTGTLCHHCFVGPPDRYAAWVSTRAGRVFDAVRMHLQPPTNGDVNTPPELVSTFSPGAVINFAEVFACAAPVVIAMNPGLFSNSLVAGALYGMPSNLTADRPGWAIVNTLIYFGSHECIFGGLNAWNHMPPTEPAVSRATWTSAHTWAETPTETTGVEWIAAYCFYVGHQVICSPSYLCTVLRTACMWTVNCETLAHAYRLLKRLCALQCVFVDLRRLQETTVGTAVRIWVNPANLLLVIQFYLRSTSKGNLTV